MNNGRWAGPIYNLAALGDAFYIRQRPTLSIPLNNAEKMRQAEFDEAAMALLRLPTTSTW